MRRKKLVPQEILKSSSKEKAPQVCGHCPFRQEDEQKRNDPAFADSYFSSYHRDLKKMTIKI